MPAYYTFETNKKWTCLFNGELVGSFELCVEPNPPDPNVARVKFRKITDDGSVREFEIDGNAIGLRVDVIKAPDVEAPASAWYQHRVELTTAAYRAGKKAAEKPATPSVLNDLAKSLLDTGVGPDDLMTIPDDIKPESVDFVPLEQNWAVNAYQDGMISQKTFLESLKLYDYVEELKEKMIVDLAIPSHLFDPRAATTGAKPSSPRPLHTPGDFTPPAIGWDLLEPQSE